MALLVDNVYSPQDRDKISYKGTLHEIKMTDPHWLRIEDAGKVLFEAPTSYFMETWGWNDGDGIWRRKG